MGDVYEAEDLQLGERVALKTIRPEIASTPEVVDQFKHEVLLARKVTHPNVCRIHDLGFDRSRNGSEQLFLTMEFLEGENLSSRIKRGPNPENEAIPLINDMADALSAVHRSNIVLRDFKSANVMLVTSDRPRAVITDFGVARALLGTSDCKSSRREASLAGTIDYMAPEQIKGENVTSGSDIYALEVVMYEMMTGRRPFNGVSPRIIALAHLNKSPQPPRALAPQLDPKWDNVILGCLRKVPTERFSTPVLRRSL